ncbi:MAG: rhodanese-like domain-containing protein [Pygmaiobacter massiliensis]|nr:rhodanese-like domain-containing protein [Pygmaiobacter massiliensis]
MAEPFFEIITPEQAHKEMADPQVVVLDLRDETEYADGHIPSAVCLPLYRLEKDAQRLFPDRNQRILLYCLSGRRAMQGARLLALDGYRRLAVFGGIQNWPFEIT